jgi:uncharacterized protein with FMN-binding domain
VKRILLTVVLTVLGIVALLSYKTHGSVASSAGGLPAAGLSSPAPTVGTTSATASSGGSNPKPKPKSSTATSASASPTSTYTGTAVNTRYGVIQVKVTVSAKKITDVAFVQLTAFDDRSQRINSDAAPILLQETLAAQSAKIDSVSGASYTSAGYEQSLQSALDQAGI